MFQAVRRATLLLAIVAMAFKGLLPTGWMPNPSGFSETAFILCDMDMSAQDMAAMMAANPDMDMSAMHMGADDGKQSPASHAHSECPFAAASHAGAAMAGAAFALPTRAAAIAEAPIPEHSAALLARYQPQSPRAPPTTSV
jgi:hypothetical protein